MNKEETWIQEDFEREYLRDEAYINEGIRRENEAEWEAWEAKNKKPAKITVYTSKKSEYETRTNK